MRINKMFFYICLFFFYLDVIKLGWIMCVIYLVEMLFNWFWNKLCVFVVCGFGLCWILKKIGRRNYKYILIILII